MTDTQAAQQDPNMPELDEVEIEAKAEVTTEIESEQEGQTVDTAPTTEVDEPKSDFVDAKDISERTQAKINKITAEKYAEKRRADELERKLNEQTAQAPTTNQQSTNEPKLEDFDYDEQAFTVALIDHRVNQKALEIQQQQQQAQAQSSQQKIASDFDLKVAKLKETKPDYEQVVANIPQLPDQTLNAIMQHEKGPELADYLGRHLDVADFMATADPMAAAMKLGQISAQLTATTKTVKTSAAPEPIEPVNSGGISNKSQEEMSMEEIMNL